MRLVPAVDDDLRARRDLPHVIDRELVVPGGHRVEQDDVRPRVAQGGHRLCAIVRDADQVEIIGLLEPEADHGTERMGVVAKEDAHDNPGG